MWNCNEEIYNIDTMALLGRPSIIIDDLGKIENDLNEQVILVTGGGGTIGSELCRQINNYSLKKLVILDIYENNAFYLQQELNFNRSNDTEIVVEIVSIQDRVEMERVFNEHRPDYVYHAAAHKHVPLMEHNVVEAVKNNIFGTQNVIELSERYGVKRFVLISTDKAINPNNIMGATKRCCEIMVQAREKKTITEYVGVRFGNVIGSSGSVLTIFERQLKKGIPLTVTNEEASRYFMTVNEAVQLLLLAGHMGKNGHILIFDMGKQVRIMDLAINYLTQMKSKSEIVITGLRSGEKLVEESLIQNGKVMETDHKKIYICQNDVIDIQKFERELYILEEILTEGNKKHVLEQLGKLLELR